MELRFLGTSGYGITATRNLPSLIIDGKILLDCGEGCFRSLYKYNYPLDQIHAIFISHLHADHISGLISLLFKLAFYMNNENFEVPRLSPRIYVPEGYKTYVTQIIQSSFGSFERVNFEVQVIELPRILKEPLTLQIGETQYQIKWIEAIHNPTCYSFLINDQIFYSGDTAPNLKLVAFLPENTVLIHESSFPDDRNILAHKLSHSTPTDAATIAKQSKGTRLILTHLPDLSSDDEQDFLKNAKKEFTNVSVAHDGDVITI